jgi:hypothetical protein
MWEVHAGVGVKGVQGRTRAYKDRRDEVTTMIPQLDEGRRRSGSVEIRVGLLFIRLLKVMRKTSCRLQGVADE